jgi:hypothetical protein
MNETKPAPQRGLVGWSTRDMLILGVCSIALGILTAGIFYVYIIVLAAFPLAAFALAGVAYLAPLFLAYLTRHPIKVLVGQLIAGLAALPFHPAGIAALVAFALYGIFTLIAVGIATRFRHFGMLPWLGAGVLCGGLNVLWNGFILRSFDMVLWANLLAASLAVISCVLVALLVRTIAHAVARTGALQGTPLGSFNPQEV